MLPSLRQRLLIGLTILVGGFCWLTVLSALQNQDGLGGVSLLSGRNGPAAGILLTVLAGLPAIALATLVAAVGNPLSGVFSFSAALTVVAIAGGSPEGWIRHAQVPGAYRGLIAETVIWNLILLGVLVLMQVVRQPLRARLPGLVQNHHLGQDTRLALPSATAWSAGLIAAATSGVLAFFLLRSSDTGQIVGGLLLAFGVGAAVGHTLLPQSNALPILLSPAVVAIISYAVVLMQFGTADEVLAGLFRETTASASLAGRLPGTAIPLPIHYLSAALAGCTIGLGIAQSMTAGSAARNLTPNAS